MSKSAPVKEAKEYAPSSSEREVAKPTLVLKVDEHNKLVKVVPDAPLWVQPGKGKWGKAKIGTAGWLLKQLSEANEEQVLKVYQARNRVSNERYNAAFDRAYQAAFKDHAIKPKIGRGLYLIERSTPNFYDHFNDLAWADIYVYALDVMYAVSGAREISARDFEVLTGAWVKFIGPVAPTQAVSA